MKFANFTRTVLRAIVALHHKAVHIDCKCVEAASVRAFKRAELQLELVQAAKDQLVVAQNQALLAQAASQKAWACAADELCSLKIGAPRG